MKMLYRVLLVIMLLFVLIGASLFFQGAHEHFNRPLVFPGTTIEAAVDGVCPRAGMA